MRSTVELVRIVPVSFTVAGHPRRFNPKVSVAPVSSFGYLALPGETLAGGDLGLKSIKFECPFFAFLGWASLNEPW